MSRSETPRWVQGDEKRALQHSRPRSPAGSSSYIRKIDLHGFYDEQCSVEAEACKPRLRGAKRHSRCPRLAILQPRQAVRQNEMAGKPWNKMCCRRQEIGEFDRQALYGASLIRKTWDCRRSNSRRSGMRKRSRRRRSSKRTFSIPTMCCES